MAETNASKMTKRMIMAGAAAGALFAGFAAAPALIGQAEAQRITPPAVAAPSGAPISFADLIQRVSPAVVSITVKQKPGADSGPSTEGLPPGFEDFIQPERGLRRTPVALGSGFIIAENGVVVTNNHVVEDANEIDIKLSDGRELKADVVGTDPGTDLAVLRIKGGGRFPYVAFDRTPTVRVGDWVIAVGNPFGLEGTATAGIISAKGRRDFGNSSYVDFMQIDAPINRGNSGGPTFDLRGNVVGVNSAIFSPTGGNVGIGFAIPSDTAARITDQLLKAGHVTRGWLGVQVQRLDPDIAASLGMPNAKGAIVLNVTPGSPSEKAGVRQGDVVLSFDGTLIDDSRDLTQKVGQTAVGKEVQLVVLREGQRKTMALRLGERPTEAQLASAEPRRGQSGSSPSSAETTGLGLKVQVLSQDDRRRYDLVGVEGGLLITSVADGSSLADNGVRPGDVILTAGPEKKPMRTPEDLSAVVNAAKQQDRPVLLQIQGRSGPPRYVAARVKRG
jgi:serine protease Do